MITLEDWFMIKNMHKQGVPKSRIARELGVSRETVRKAISEKEYTVSDPFRKNGRSRCYDFCCHPAY